MVHRKRTADGVRGRASGRAHRLAACKGIYHENCSEAGEAYSEDDFRPFGYILSSFISLIFFFVLLSPSVGYAKPVLEIDGNFAGYEDGYQYKGYVVCDSPDAYTSTFVLTESYAKLIQVDSTMYAKLSSADKGGAFYQLMQKWEHIGTSPNGANENYPSWISSVRDFVDGLNAVYGYDRNWELVCTNTEIENAKRDLDAILRGENVGGGGSGEDDEDDGITEGNYTILPWTEVVVDYEPAYAGVAIPTSQYVAFKAAAKANTADVGLYIALGTSSLSNSWNNWRCGAVTKPEINADGTISYTDYTRKSGVSSKTWVTYEGKNYLITGGITATWGSDAVTTESGTYSVSKPYVAYYWSKGESGGGGDTPVNPVDPPEDPKPTKPDPDAPEPTDPDVPRLPNPIEPDYPDPPVHNPPFTPNEPDAPLPRMYDPYEVPDTDPYPEPTNYDNIDYTPWLRAIFNELVAIHNYLAECMDFLAYEMEDHCIHIRAHMTSCFDSLAEYLATELYNNMVVLYTNNKYNAEYIADTIQESTEVLFTNGWNYFYYIERQLNTLFGHLEQYLQEVAQYIVDNLNWSNGDGVLDESNVLYWLKRIWAKMGSGTVNTKPSDPVSNYPVYVQWLGNLFDDIGLDLTGLDIGPLIDAITGLKDIFPFSIPWNIIAVFGLLAATPAIPSATIAIPDNIFFEGYSYSFDMTWLDGVMPTVRAIELLAFVCYVIVHTKDFAGFLLGDEI